MFTYIGPQNSPTLSLLEVISSYFQPFSRYIVKPNRPGQTNQKQVVRSIFPLYQSHYEVRRTIAMGFEERLQARSSSKRTCQNAAFELSICHTLGFGVLKDDSKALDLLKYSEKSQEDLVEEINQVRSNDGRPRSRSGVYLSALHRGHTKSTTGGRMYQEQGLLDKAASWIEQEITDLQRVLGSDHRIIAVLRSTLCKVYVVQERFKEAQMLEIQVLDSSSRSLGCDHPDTLGSRSHLAIILYLQKQWGKAELLQRQTVTASLSAIGIDHGGTLTSMALLADMIQDQGRLEEAERLWEHILEIRRRTFGSEDLDTVRASKKLSQLNNEQVFWKNAESEATQVIPRSHILIERLLTASSFRGRVLA